MTMKAIKPAVKQARKGGKATKTGNARKAKNTSKAPKLMPVDVALEEVTLGNFHAVHANIDTSAIPVDYKVHIPKMGVHKGEETMKMKVTVGGKDRYIPEYYALLFAQGLREHADFVLQFEEYARGNPHAQ